MQTIDASAMRQSSDSMIGSGTRSMSTERPISVAWFARNMRSVSMSEVQRCTRSPDGIPSSVLHGRRCTWSYIRSRVRRATRSAAPVAKRVLRWIATPESTASAIIASAGIQSASRTRSVPPIQPTIAREIAEGSAAGSSTRSNTLFGTSGAA